jgi:hypothetical protein
MKHITEENFYINYGNIKVKFYSYWKGEFILGGVNDSVEVTINVADDVKGKFLNIYFNTEYLISDLKDFIICGGILDLSKGYIVEDYYKDN